MLASAKNSHTGRQVARRSGDSAHVQDKHPLPGLLHGNERRVYGDSAYASQKDLIAGKAPNAKDFINQGTRCAGNH